MGRRDEIKAKGNKREWNINKLPGKCTRVVALFNRRNVGIVTVLKSA
jgi:hypothetical protein